MITTNNIIIHDDIVLFKPGKYNKPVGYTIGGKVILCRHNIKLGYAKISRIEDKGKFILVDATHIIKDIYPTISVYEFTKTLPMHGYKVGFDRRFNDPSTNTIEHLIFAYNLNNYSIIVAKTRTKQCKQQFRSIMVYCPGIPHNYLYNILSMVKYGDRVMSVYDLTKMNKFHDGYPLEYITSVILPTHNKFWPGSWFPDLSISSNVVDDVRRQDNWYRTMIEFVRDSECLKIFENCDFVI